MTQAVLLDTHILIWLRLAPERLTPAERRAIDIAPCRYVSAVTLWEIAILIGLGRIESSPRLFDLPDGIEFLAITASHCRELLDLPSIHKDPFDRMLISQARADRLLLVTRDSQITAYGKAGANTANLAQ
jgi:PIN domain nuclease of toxin-antitoxin system